MPFPGCKGLYFTRIPAASPMELWIFMEFAEKRKPVLKMWKETLEAVPKTGYNAGRSIRKEYLFWNNSNCF